MSKCLQFSSSLNVSRWPYWFYTKCLRCDYAQRVGVGYAPGPDPVTFDPQEQCAYFSKLLDAHAGAVGNRRNDFQVRQCSKCEKIHADWAYLTDHEYIAEKTRSVSFTRNQVNSKTGSKKVLSELKMLAKSTYQMQPVVKYQESVQKKD